MKTYKSVCRNCHGGCSVLLHVKDGRLIKIRPNPESPFNLGQLCIKGLLTPEIIYHSERLQKPLKRVGDRGAMNWREIDWDDALDEIVDQMDRMIKVSGPESIAIGLGTGRHHFMHTVRFANALGTPNWYAQLANCLLPRLTVSYLTYGGYVVADYYGKVQPKTILFWGHNPVVTGPDGELAFPVKRALKSGSYGITIDPRRSETAKRCRMWLPLRPGTDDALALAMIHVIIKDELYDKKFVEKWTIGFDELKSHVGKYTPQWAEEVTWVPAWDIIRAARRYALDKPSVIEWGVAIEQTPNSLQTVRALSILRGLTGNIDIPGGDILGMEILRPYPLLNNKLPGKSALKRIGREEFKLLSGFRSYLPSAHLAGIFTAMRTGKPYRIRGLLNFSTNPMLTVANTREVYQALKQLDLLVVADMFMTPTAALADYVLPAAFWPEIDQIIELPYVAKNAVFAQQKAVQVGLCRPDEEILDELSKRLNLPGSDVSLESIINYQLEPIGIDFETLKQKHMVFPEHQYKKYENKGFKTPLKKIELYSRTLEKMGYDPLPAYQEPPESPFNCPELKKTYPYVLTTGSRRCEFFHSEHRQIEGLRKRRPFPLAEIHPDLAEKHDIRDGDWVYVGTRRGKIKMKAKVTEDIRNGVVNIDHGWWFPEQKGPDFGVWESNANILTANTPPYDPGFGTFQLRGLLCRIEKSPTAEK